MNGYYIILIGFLLIFIGILGFLNSYLIIMGVGLIIIGVPFVKGFRNKTYYLAIFTVIALLGLTSVYSLLYVTTDKINSYLGIGFFILWLITFSIAYLRRHDAIKIVWKNEW